MTVNWKGMQAAGCKKLSFVPPSGVKPKYMTGGYWRADLLQDGKLRPKKKKN